MDAVQVWTKSSPGAVDGACVQTLLLLILERICRSASRLAQELLIALARHLIGSTDLDCPAAVCIVWHQRSVVSSGILSLMTTGNMPNGILNLLSLHSLISIRRHHPDEQRHFWQRSTMVWRAGRDCSKPSRACRQQGVCRSLTVQTLIGQIDVEALGGACHPRPGTGHSHSVIGPPKPVLGG